jgi:glycosidase
MMEFHIARKARERYQFAGTLFSFDGNVIAGSVALCRELTFRMNKVRDAEAHPEQAVHAAHLYAMGLIDEASHLLFEKYREELDPEVLKGALEWFEHRVGDEWVEKLLLRFVEEFPGADVYAGKVSAAEWLQGATNGMGHREAAFEEMVLLWLANRNPAFEPFEELFRETDVERGSVYRLVTSGLTAFFATRPKIDVPDEGPMSLIELLRAPIEGAPRSLADQMELIRKLWRPLVKDELDKLLQTAAAILHEEELAIWQQYHPAAENAAASEREAARRGHQGGPEAEGHVPNFAEIAHEYEKFSPDTQWMPNTVLIAKSTFVWLAQLSRFYGREIRTLDQIPDAELETLAARGMNALWLIGVWERSRASKTIKQLCGNTDAVASAYSLFDYRIADALGGEGAYENLRDRAMRFGIRLASDMVPNHMGIDSPWVVEHPEWFISRWDRPYPAYSFEGPDLSQDGRVEIKIEDHYYSQSDAAVVFQRRDRATGETRFIYHGNDGTSFPWNDTAQLDYMNPAVREQVIQTILEVARRFPIIRFDAAMTLAKRHFHRLWFPGPGASGSIPSRAEYGMDVAEFNKAMPHEFWREVVDRVATEVPGTLLLAEAFWLMEGYFVRTLGMHRVYNSAFMVMLRDEDNEKYRSVIKNTLEFDADIMKRYVNFMSNPDERTAVDQFGTGDKCFGVAVMMATLPGLPMFGHGQVEGFTEKYGMEYYKPRYEEWPNHGLVDRHQREVAPLLKRRWLFAESVNFLLYDFFTGSGAVDENVYAYSNQTGDQKALVVFNNRYGSTRGTIDHSAAYADKGSGELRQRRLSEGLALGSDALTVIAWRDSLTGLQYLKRKPDLLHSGLTLELGPYQSHVFMDWQELHSTAEYPWDRLCDHLNGRGVPDLTDALMELELAPVHDALRAVLAPDQVRHFAGLAEQPKSAKLTNGHAKGVELERRRFIDEHWLRVEKFLGEAQRAYEVRAANAAKPDEPLMLGYAMQRRVRAAMKLPLVEQYFAKPWSEEAREILPSASPKVASTAVWGPVMAWSVLELLAESFEPEHPAQVGVDLFDKLRLREPFARSFEALGFEGEEAWRAAARIKVGLLTEKESYEEIEAEVLADETKVAAVAPTAEAKVVPVVTAAAVPEVDAEESEEVEASELISRDLWQDPDVRWLAGVHHAEEKLYLVREKYEALLWWLLLPKLLRLAEKPETNKVELAELGEAVAASMAEAKAKSYRVEPLMGIEVEPEAVEEAAAEIEEDDVAVETSDGAASEEKGVAKEVNTIAAVERPVAAEAVKPSVDEQKKSVAVEQSKPEINPTDALRDALRSYKEQLKKKE